MQKKPLIIALVLYVVSALFSYGAFSYFGGAVSPLVTEEAIEDLEEQRAGALLTIDPNAKRDQACPLSGKLFTQVERDAWETRRPLAVMIENHPESRPQSGLSQADIVFEAVAEGGVTRFMGMFYCDVQDFDTTLAPIRSARTYFVDYASGFNLPLYVHVGGANVPGPTDALGQIADYGWNGENDLNQFSIGYPTFVRDYNRLDGKQIATEHTMVTTTEALWEVAEERGWTNITPERRVGRKLIPESDWQEGFTSWSFEDETEAGDEATTISYEFWSGYDDYAVDWVLDTESGMYMRSQGGEEHVDLNDGVRVKAANVVVLLTTEKGPINEKKHMLYGTTGTGDALLFKNGTVSEITWSKKDREAELQLLDAKGKPVELARGLTWISVVSDDSQVEY